MSGSKIRHFFTKNRDFSIPFYLQQFLLICVAGLLVGCEPLSSESLGSKKGEELVSTNEPEKGSDVRLSKVKERSPILVTGDEVLQFPNGPCFKLGQLEDLGPSLINVNLPNSEREINLSTLSPLKFVDKLPEGSVSLSVDTPIYSMRFDTHLSKLGFSPPSKGLNELYLHGADRFLAEINPTSGVLPENHSRYRPSAIMDVDQWLRRVESGDLYELELPDGRGRRIKFYAFSPGGEYDINRVGMYYGYDFENSRLVKLRHSDYVPEPFTLLGVARPNFHKTDYSAQLFQYLFDGQLYSEFAVTRDYLLDSDEIFEVVNSRLLAAVIRCNGEDLVQ